MNEPLTDPWQVVTAQLHCATPLIDERVTETDVIFVLRRHAKDQRLLY